MLDNRRHMEESDLMMRSILEQGHEDVPAGIWDGVAAGLDRIEAGKKAAGLWWRRAAIGAAVAAALAVGVFIDMDSVPDMDIVPSSILIAERGQTQIDIIPLESPAPVMAALHRPAVTTRETMQGSSAAATSSETPSAPAMTMIDKDKASKEFTADDSKTSPTKKQEEVLFPEEWEDEADVKTEKRVRTSLVLSGIAGSNSSPHSALKTLMRLPGAGSQLKKTNITEKEESTYGLPVSFGAGVKVDLSPRWSVAAGISYTMLSREFYGTYTEVRNEEVTLYNSDIRNKQQYIGIPVNVFYNIIDRERVSLYAYIGGTAEKCLSDSYDVLAHSITHREQVNGLQWSAGAGIGVEFTPWKRLGIYLDPSLKYYFDCNQPKSIRTAQPLMFSLELGLRFRL